MCALVFLLYHSLPPLSFLNTFIFFLPFPYHRPMPIIIPMGKPNLMFGDLRDQQKDSSAMTLNFL